MTSIAIKKSSLITDSDRGAYNSLRTANISPTTPVVELNWLSLVRIKDSYLQYKFSDSPNADLVLNRIFFPVTAPTLGSAKLQANLLTTSSRKILLASEKRIISPWVKGTT